MSDILADFLIDTPSGYFCRYGNFYIDPLMPVDTAVVSHAHGDHARPGHQQIVATASTIAFMQLRFPKQPSSSYIDKIYHSWFELGGVEISFIPAGHILGSAQILMVYQGIRYLYTGDYKLQVDPTCEPLAHVRADVLITETTFANPATSHPDPVEEIKKLSQTSFHIMLGAYSLGKAQRLTHMINVYCPEKTIYVHHNILPIHKIYETRGLVPLKYEVYNRKSLKEGSNKIYLLPPMTFNNYFRAKNVLRAFASGWERLQNHNDISLYISDHVDWKDLLHYIDLVQPREIWTVHGDGTPLKEYHHREIVVRDIGKIS